MQPEVGASLRRFPYDECWSGNSGRQTVEKVVASRSRWDLGTLRSPVRRAEMPRNWAVPKMRGFLRATRVRAIDAMQDLNVLTKV